MKKKIFVILLLIIFEIFALFLTKNILNQEQKIAMGIFLIAVFFWLSEIIPIYATSLLVVLLESLFLGGALKVVKSLKVVVPYSTFIETLFDPVIMLFLGGFVLADALHKYSIDTFLASVMLKKIKKTPKIILLGFILFTAFMSMWMSNTATTAIMMAIAIPVVKSVEDANFKKSLILSIPFAANIGGIGTPVGTPPNAIAIGNLSKIGIEISFLEWASIGIPVVLLFVFILWVILTLIFPVKSVNFDFSHIKEKEISKEGRRVTTIFIITALLWLLDAVHHIPSYIVAMLPIVYLLGTKLMSKDDFLKVDWDILIFLGGALALGVGISKTQLPQAFLSLINIKALHQNALIYAIALASTILSTFMSHSPTASLLIPIVVSLGDPKILAIVAAMVTSSGMSLPISTPPNAIAYSSGEIKIKDMFKSGVIISIIMTLIIPLLVFLILKIYS